LVLVRGEAGIGKSTLVEAFAAGRAGRVLRGMCDPVVPPRPLAPIFDIADHVGGALRAALDDPDRHRILSAFLGLLRAEGGPWVVVLEDVQWADDATLDLLTVIGRRSAQLHALVIATVRDDEVGPDHPLSVALGDISSACMMSVVLEPLSIGAVAELAVSAGVDAEELHRVTWGNPFFVTEILASGGAELPLTVRDAVWARSRRLSPAGLRVLTPTCSALWVRRNRPGSTNASTLACFGVNDRSSSFATSCPGSPSWNHWLHQSGHSFTIGRCRRYVCTHRVPTLRSSPVTPSRQATPMQFLN
jgi:hypothetical protein